MSRLHRHHTIVLAIASSFAVTSLAACTQKHDGVAGVRSASSERYATFDPDDVLDDASMTDTSMTADDVQQLLDATPYGRRSVLADYVPSSTRTAAQIIVAEAVRRDLNPMLLLVRAQLESGLVSKRTATATELARAFGCGPAGFELQARCAAGQLRAALDNVSGKRRGDAGAYATTDGTARGWSVGRRHVTRDGIAVTPANAATAVLYAYKPWVGQLGDGDPDVGGVSAHWRLWNDFTAAPAAESECVTSADCSDDKSRTCDRLHGVCVDRPTGGDAVDAAAVDFDAGADAGADAGGPAPEAPAGSSSQDPPAPPEPSRAPTPELPSSDEAEQAPRADGGRKSDEAIDLPPSESSGCTTSPSHPGPAPSPIGQASAAVAILLATALRRRRKADG